MSIRRMCTRRLALAKGTRGGKIAFIQFEYSRLDIPGLKFGSKKRG